jgi:CRISPR-associated endonuclease/helicase Cas3
MDSDHRYYAHSCDKAPDRNEWHGLSEHLCAVARLAEFFAQKWRAGDWGYNLGLLHDRGKYSRSFQNYLLRSTASDYHTAEINEQIDHSSSGAQHAVAMFPVLGHLLAYVAAGHHAGLMDAIGVGANLDKRLKKVVETCEPAASELPPMRLDLALPDFLQSALRTRGSKPQEAGFSLSFFVRMLFSCLVDADFLDT